LDKIVFWKLLKGRQQIVLFLYIFFCLFGQSLFDFDLAVGNEESNTLLMSLYILLTALLNIFQVGFGQKIIKKYPKYVFCKV